VAFRGHHPSLLLLSRWLFFLSLPRLLRADRSPLLHGGYVFEETRVSGLNRISTETQGRHLACGQVRAAVDTGVNMLDTVLQLDRGCFQVDALHRHLLRSFRQADE
jgi:hypothetical protein